MKTYPNYKIIGTSSTPFPEHWASIKPKYALELAKGRKPSDTTIEPNGCLPYLSMDVLRGRDCMVQYPTDNSDLVVVQEEDVLVLWDGANAGEIISAKPGYLSSTMALIDVDQSRLDKKFSFYLFKSREPEFKNRASGTTIPHFDGNYFLNTPIAVPPITEQLSINSYLDEVTGRIDALISEKSAQVDELRAYRSSLITETITLGLNPDAPIRDSGIDLLGRTPKHWEVTKLKYITDKVGSGVTPKGGAEVYSESGVLFIRSQNVYPDGLHLDEPTYISEEIDEKMSNSRVYKGDILLNITGASIGRCCVYSLENNANVNQHVCIVRPIADKIRDKFLQFVLNSNIGQTQIKFSQTGGNREGLNFEQLKNFLIPIPPLSEQQEIADFLVEKTIKIDCLIEELTKQLDELAEYKQAVITEAVTGKVDVRDYNMNT